jgi:hypothetical protein
MEKWRIRASSSGSDVIASMWMESNQRRIFKSHKYPCPPQFFAHPNEQLIDEKRDKDISINTALKLMVIRTHISTVSTGF